MKQVVFLRFSLPTSSTEVKKSKLENQKEFENKSKYYLGYHYAPPDRYRLGIFSISYHSAGSTDQKSQDMVCAVKREAQ